MPVHSNPKRKKAARGGRWAMTIVLLLLLGVLVSMAVWAAWSLLAMPDQNKELELPETAQVLGLVLADTLQPQPEDFVTGLDGTGITVSFEERPDNTVGKQLVTLNFSDGKKTCSRQTTLQVFHLEQKVTVVMGQEQLPGIRDFVPDESLAASFVGSAPDQIPLDQCGEKILVIACSGREYEVIYSVEERIAPQGTPVHGTTEAGKLPDPATLVTDIVDHSAVTVTYQQVPELTVVGSVNVTLVLTDAYGNTATVESVINVIPAANAPHFEGLKDLYIRLGNTIAYKADVTALDDKDGQLSFTVDASSVDNMTEGTYTVYYSATDSDGNTTIMPRKIVVETVDRAAVEAYARAVLDSIITEGMTLDQKIHAVYYYSRHKVWYVGTSDKTSIYHAAYEGFSTKKGDCYTYYAMNVVMFDMLGLEHLSVKRVGGSSNHYWNLVLHEDGKYYHVDSTPTAVSVTGVNHGKMTESDIQKYTQDPTVAGRRPNFYVYDKTLPEYEGIEIAP